jgi:hypothetical protein
MHAPRNIQHQPTITTTIAIPISIAINVIVYRPASTLTLASAVFIEGQPYTTFADRIDASRRAMS